MVESSPSRLICPAPLSQFLSLNSTISLRMPITKMSVFQPALERLWNLWKIHQSQSQCYRNTGVGRDQKEKARGQHQQKPRRARRHFVLAHSKLNVHSSIRGVKKEMKGTSISRSRPPYIATDCLAPSNGSNQPTLPPTKVSDLGFNLVSAKLKSSTVPILKILIPGQVSPTRYMRVPQVEQK